MEGVSEEDVRRIVELARRSRQRKRTNENDRRSRPSSPLVGAPRDVARTFIPDTIDRRISRIDRQHQRLELRRAKPGAHNSDDSKTNGLPGSNRKPGRDSDAGSLAARVFSSQASAREHPHAKQQREMCNQRQELRELRRLQRRRQPGSVDGPSTPRAEPIAAVPLTGRSSSSLSLLTSKRDAGGVNFGLARLTVATRGALSTSKTPKPTPDEEKKTTASLEDVASASTALPASLSAPSTSTSSSSAEGSAKGLSRSPLYNAIRENVAKSNFKPLGHRRKYQRNFERAAPIVSGSTDINLHLRHYDANHGERYELFGEAYKTQLSDEGGNRVTNANSETSGTRKQRSRHRRKLSSGKMPILGRRVGQAPSTTSEIVSPNVDANPGDSDEEGIENERESKHAKKEPISRAQRPASPSEVVSTAENEARIRSAGLEGFDKMAEEEDCIFKFLRMCKEGGIVASHSMMKAVLPAHNSGNMKLSGAFSGGGALLALAKILNIDHEEEEQQVPGTNRRRVMSAPTNRSTATGLGAFSTAASGQRKFGLRGVLDSSGVAKAGSASGISGRGQGRAASAPKVAVLKLPSSRSSSTSSSRASTSRSRPVSARQQSSRRIYQPARVSGGSGGGSRTPRTPRQLPNGSSTGVGAYSARDNTGVLRGMDSGDHRARRLDGLHGQYGLRVPSPMPTTDDGETLAKSVNSDRETIQSTKSRKQKSNEEQEAQMRKLILGSVTTLTIHDHRLTRPSCSIVCGMIAHSEQLVRIDLKIRSFGLLDPTSDLGAVVWPATIRELLLRECGLRDLAVEAICKSSSKLPDRLEVLDLSSNKLTDSAASCVSEHFLERDDSKLQELRLDGNLLTAQCLTFLARGLTVGGTSLHTLSLAGNNLSGNGIMTSSFAERKATIDREGGKGQRAESGELLPWQIALNPNDKDISSEGGPQEYARILSGMPVPNKLMKVYTEVARIYERKAHADMVNDGLHNARDELSTFVQVHFRTKYGMERISMQRLQELHNDVLQLISSAHLHNFVAANCVVRLYWFAVLCGWVDFQPQAPSSQRNTLAAHETRRQVAKQQAKSKMSATNGERAPGAGLAHPLPAGTKFFCTNFLLDCLKFFMKMTFIDETIRKIPVYVELDRVISLVLNPAARGCHEEVGGCFLKHKGTTAVDDLIKRLDRSSVQIASFQSGVITETVEQQAHLKTTTKWVVLLEDAMDALLRAWLHLREDGVTVKVQHVADLAHTHNSNHEGSDESAAGASGGNSNQGDRTAQLLALGLGDKKMFSSKDLFVMGLVNNGALRVLDLGDCSLSAQDCPFVHMLLLSSKSLISVRLEGNSLRIDRETMTVLAVIPKATASVLSPQHLRATSGRQRRGSSAGRRRPRPGSGAGGFDETVAALDDVYEGPDVETRYVCRHDSRLPHSRHDPDRTPAGTPNGSPAGSPAATPEPSPRQRKIRSLRSPGGKAAAKKKAAEEKEKARVLAESRRVERERKALVQARGRWQRQSPFTMDTWVPTTVCWYTSKLPPSSEPTNGSELSPQQPNGDIQGEQPTPTFKTSGPPQTAAEREMADEAQRVMVPVKFVYIPRVLGPAFVDKLELMVWSDDRRWADRSGHPWSNHCLFKSGGKGEDTGSMSYAERRVMEKVHVILQACSRLQWRYRRSKLLRKFRQNGGDIFETYRAFLTAQLEGTNREAPFFAACACPESAKVAERHRQANEPEAEEKTPNFTRYRATTASIMRSAARPKSGSSPPPHDEFMLNINGGEPVMPDPTSARELIAEQDAEDASEADVALIAYMLNVGEDPNQVNPTDGATPLFRAVAARNVEAVKLLVEAGARVNHRNATTKRTPLHYAYKYGCFPVALYLLLHGGNDFVTGTSGRRPSELNPELHRRVLAKLHGVRRNHLAALEAVNRSAKATDRVEYRGKGSKLSNGPGTELNANAKEAAATFTQHHADGLSLKSLETVDISGTEVIERVLLCPQGRIYFHFFVDGHPVLLSHVQTASCGRRTYNGGVQYISLANTSLVIPRAQRQPRSASSPTVAVPAVQTVGGETVGSIGSSSSEDLARRHDPWSVDSILEGWLDDMLTTAKNRATAAQAAASEGVVVQPTPRVQTLFVLFHHYYYLVVATLQVAGRGRVCVFLSRCATVCSPWQENV
eukprot:INCI7255.2.p1 GENE.INCI7255.2~~INCI7255.2.p1  ORF type:complete len:2144 (+),score=306.74 INCI7255.2:432-6863(+)